jgi:hypothetical protein
MLRLSSICYKIEVVFHFIKIEVVFHYPIMRSSSIYYKIEVVFHFIKIEVVFHFIKIGVVFHFINFKSSSVPVRVLGQVLLISSYFTSSPGRPGGRAAGRMLDISKLRLISASSKA